VKDFPRPWIRVFESSGRGPIALVICEMCNWQYKPRTRNGIARAIRLHWDCGFKTSKNLTR
jgi:hypothetical protein